MPSEALSEFLGRNGFDAQGLGLVELAACVLSGNDEVGTGGDARGRTAPALVISSVVSVRKRSARDPVIVPATATVIPADGSSVSAFWAAVSALASA
ncbi:hypothetical protein OHA16_02625 [Kitasatospora purpeofusca]|uniref:Uncharacterized protein n=1 Tax=Kitasatospora purpeofusca TaxID=67352 RepID=A0ABZ1TV05_9ACTN